MHKIILSCFLFCSLSANDFSINPSFQGYTGVINTPNAQVIKEGHATLHVNNQFDNSNRSYNYNAKKNPQEDYIVGFGLFSFIEVQGRLSEAKGYHRDLSANVKVQVPLHYKYLPNIAFGAQDLGGAANNYGNYYGVMDKELWITRTSIGYGSTRTKGKRKKRMNGVFGAIEIKASDSFYFMLENDTTENFVALRFETPKSWFEAFNLRTTISQNITNSETSFGVTVDIPLYHTSRVQNNINSKYITDVKETQEDTSPIIKHNIKKIKVDIKNSINSIEVFENRLVEFGFDNIRVASKDDTLYIEVENNIFDHTDLDALGYVIGTFSKSKMNLSKYRLTLLKNNIKIIRVSGNKKDFSDFIDDDSLLRKNRLINNLSFDRKFDENIVYSDKKNSSFFIPRVELSLGLLTTVGTEVGVFDYLASLRVNTYMNIYDGLVLSAMYEVPLSNSNDFDKGGTFYNRYKDVLKNRLVGAMIHQTIRVDKLINTLSIGKYKAYYYGAMNQANYTTTSGEHGFNYKVGYFVDNRDSNNKDKFFSLGSYRYVYSPLDVYTEVTYGKFWNGDVGSQLKFKRFFGETSVSFNYKYTSLNSIKEEFAGIQITFPMTTRKLLKSRYVQVKGKKDFSYAIQSTIRKGDGTNTLNFNSAVIPEFDFDISREYLNRDRQSSSYIKLHIDRLREAYLTYKE